jgi:hypothetical protein
VSFSAGSEAVPFPFVEKVKLFPALKRWAKFGRPSGALTAALKPSTPTRQNRACWGPRPSTPTRQNRACWGPRCCATQRQTRKSARRGAPASFQNNVKIASFTGSWNPALPQSARKDGASSASLQTIKIPALHPVMASAFRVRRILWPSRTCL